ncbi:solute carrier organic anion transporter family member 1C1-like [Thalassophryne amazonica]|uniref:solute carrier organic anion transporter family member 1C1-like n=1 Tax=Thalassophryne amazonica TaxID=390379 RepID=UPI0014711C89|nr:solute carrier organic anion transporter family member 1C1-like [Thalassophryne amazonica]
MAIATPETATPDGCFSSSAMKHSCPNVKMFVSALSFAYFATALSGSYMKHIITQLQRHFNVPRDLKGITDRSFKIGNLFVIAFVSYFGAKFHRPKLIAVGCVLMSFGTFLMAMPHFSIGRYETDTSVRPSVNSTSNLSLCPAKSTNSAERATITSSKGCDQVSSVSWWIYLLLGNVIRGIGETPIQPLGISYIDDHATSENTALYIDVLQTVSVVGPVFGYMLGSLCAKIHMDISDVDINGVTINPGDGGWLGAWWLGFLISGSITLMTAVPFWFLPKSLPVPTEKYDNNCTTEQTRFIKDSPGMATRFRPKEPANLPQMAKDFASTLKSLLGNHIFMIYLYVTIIHLNSVIGLDTYRPKYFQQLYGQSASKASFLMGMTNVLAVSLGMLSGGFIMKKYKLGVMGAAKFAFTSSLLGYFLSFFFLAMGCEGPRVASVTVSYTGVENPPGCQESVLSDCNSGCSCSQKEWHPVCGENRITYISPCLAGCTSSAGFGKNMVFDNCRCVKLDNFQPGNLTATLGQCPHIDSCQSIFPYFLTLSMLTFINPELKSLTLGIYILASRMLAGMPAPVYFGAAIDTTCRHWEERTCGECGECQLHNTSAYRIVFLGLTLGLRTVSYFLCILGFVLLKRHIKRKENNALLHGSAELDTMGKEEIFVFPDCSFKAETHF